MKKVKNEYLSERFNSAMLFWCLLGGFFVSAIWILIAYSATDTPTFKSFMITLVSVALLLAAIRLLAFTKYEKWLIRKLNEAESYYDRLIKCRDFHEQLIEYSKLLSSLFILNNAASWGVAWRKEVNGEVHGYRIVDIFDLHGKYSEKKIPEEYITKCEDFFKAFENIYGKIDDAKENYFSIVSLQTKDEHELKSLIVEYDNKISEYKDALSHLQVLTEY